MCHGENSSLFKVTYVRDMDEFLATTSVISPINRANVQGIVSWDEVKPRKR